MTALVWDQAGERRYETGLDRGVLYPPTGDPVVWNGLTSITESRARELKSYYLDGVKYLDSSTPGSYSARLQAFTYPEELESLVGNAQFAPGVTLYDQPAKLFHLSYRSQIGNDLEGLDFGYKIHVIYNVLASPSDVTFDTQAQSVSSGKQFEWELRGAPPQMAGYRPANHISLDSRLVEPSILAMVETHLYGSETEDPHLPNLLLFLGLISP